MMWQDDMIGIRKEVSNFAKIASYRIVSYRIVLYCIVLYCIVLYCIVLYYCVSFYSVIIYEAIQSFVSCLVFAYPLNLVSEPCPFQCRHTSTAGHLPRQQALCHLLFVLYRVV